MVTQIPHHNLHGLSCLVFLGHSCLLWWLVLLFALDPPLLFFLEVLFWILLLFDILQNSSETVLVTLIIVALKILGNYLSPVAEVRRFNSSAVISTRARKQGIFP